MKTPDVFTPLTPSGQRMRFPIDHVHVVSGDLWARRGGRKATVEINGTRYAVFGRACDLIGCACDAEIRPLD